MANGKGSSLFWESLNATPQGRWSGSTAGNEPARPRRLPFDKRCAGTTRSGRRCKGRIQKGSDYCSFHDPSMTSEKRKRNAAMGGRSRANLAHIPGGYLRKLDSLRAIGDAMDRLYREVRLGQVTPEMGDVLFRILTRVLDSGLLTSATGRAPSRRAKAVKVRSKLAELLTLEERRAWRQAVAHAPAEFIHHLGQQNEASGATRNSTNTEVGAAVSAAS